MTKELGATILVSRAVAERLPEGSLSVTATKMAHARKAERHRGSSVDSFSDPSPFALAQHAIGRLLDDPSVFAARF